MAKAYSLDLRGRILESYENQEGSIRNLAKRYKVSKDFVHKLLKRYRQEKTLKPKVQGGSQARIQAAGKKYLCCLLKVEPDLTLEALRDRYYQAFGDYLGTTTIHDSLTRWKISRKKNSSMTQGKKRSV
jgi:putative transposase